MSCSKLRNNSQALGHGETAKNRSRCLTGKGGVTAYAKNLKEKTGLSCRIIELSGNQTRMDNLMKVDEEAERIRLHNVLPLTRGESAMSDLRYNVYGDDYFTHCNHEFSDIGTNINCPCHPGYRFNNELFSVIYLLVDVGYYFDGYNWVSFGSNIGAVPDQSGSTLFEGAIFTINSLFPRETNRALCFDDEVFQIRTEKSLIANTFGDSIIFESNINNVNWYQDGSKQVGKVKVNITNYVTEGSCVLSRVWFSTTGQSSNIISPNIFHCTWQVHQGYGFDHLGNRQYLIAYCSDEGWNQLFQRIRLGVSDWEAYLNSVTNLLSDKNYQGHFSSLNPSFWTMRAVSVKTVTLFHMAHETLLPVGSWVVKSNSLSNIIKAMFGLRAGGLSDVLEGSDTWDFKRLTELWDHCSKIGFTTIQVVLVLVMVFFPPSIPIIIPTLITMNVSKYFGVIYDYLSNNASIKDDLVGRLMKVHSYPAWKVSTPTDLNTTHYTLDGFEFDINSNNFELLLEVGYRSLTALSLPTGSIVRPPFHYIRDRSGFGCVICHSQDSKYYKKLDQTYCLAHVLDTEYHPESAFQRTLHETNFCEPKSYSGYCYLNYIILNNKYRETRKVDILPNEGKLIGRFKAGAFLQAGLVSHVAVGGDHTAKLTRYSIWGDGIDLVQGFPSPKGYSSFIQNLNDGFCVAHSLVPNTKIMMRPRMTCRSCVAEGKWTSSAQPTDDEVDNFLTSHQLAMKSTVGFEVVQNGKSFRTRYTHQDTFCRCGSRDWWYVVEGGEDPIAIAVVKFNWISARKNPALELHSVIICGGINYTIVASRCNHSMLTVGPGTIFNFITDANDVFSCGVLHCLEDQFACPNCASSPRCCHVWDCSNIDIIDWNTNTASIFLIPKKPINRILNKVKVKKDSVLSLSTTLSFLLSDVKKMFKEDNEDIKSVNPRDSRVTQFYFWDHTSTLENEMMKTIVNYTRGLLKQPTRVQPVIVDVEHGPHVLHQPQLDTFAGDFEEGCFYELYINRNIDVLKQPYTVKQLSETCRIIRGECLFTSLADDFDFKYDINDHLLADRPIVSGSGLIIETSKWDEQLHRLNKDNIGVTIVNSIRHFDLHSKILFLFCDFNFEDIVKYHELFQSERGSYVTGILRDVTACDYFDFESITKSLFNMKKLMNDFCYSWASCFENDIPGYFNKPKWIRAFTERLGNYDISYYQVIEGNILHIYHYQQELVIGEIVFDDTKILFISRESDNIAIPLGKCLDKVFSIRILLATKSKTEYSVDVDGINGKKQFWRNLPFWQKNICSLNLSNKPAVDLIAKARNQNQKEKNTKVDSTISKPISNLNTVQDKSNSKNVKEKSVGDKKESEKRKEEKNDNPVKDVKKEESDDECYRPSTDDDEFQNPSEMREVSGIKIDAKPSKNVDSSATTTTTTSSTPSKPNTSQKNGGTTTDFPPLSSSFVKSSDAGFDFGFGKSDALSKKIEEPVKFGEVANLQVNESTNFPPRIKYSEVARLGTSKKCLQRLRVDVHSLLFSHEIKLADFKRDNGFDPWEDNWKPLDYKLVIVDEDSNGEVAFYCDPEENRPFITKYLAKVHNVIMVYCPRQENVRSAFEYKSMERGRFFYNCSLNNKKLDSLMKTKNWISCSLTHMRPLSEKEASCPIPQCKNYIFGDKNVGNLCKMIDESDSDGNGEDDDNYQKEDEESDADKKWASLQEYFAENNVVINTFRWNCNYTEGHCDAMYERALLDFPTRNKKEHPAVTWWRVDAKKMIGQTLEIKYYQVWGAWGTGKTYTFSPFIPESNQEAPSRSMAETSGGHTIHTLLNKINPHYAVLGDECCRWPAELMYSWLTKTQKKVLILIGDFMQLKFVPDHDELATAIPYTSAESFLAKTIIYRSRTPLQEMMTYQQYNSPDSNWMRTIGTQVTFSEAIPPGKDVIYAFGNKEFPEPRFVKGYVIVINHKHSKYFEGKKMNDVKIITHAQAQGMNISNENDETNYFYLKFDNRTKDEDTLFANAHYLIPVTRFVGTCHIITNDPNKLKRILDSISDGRLKMTPDGFTLNAREGIPITKPALKIARGLTRQTKYSRLCELLTSNSVELGRVCDTNFRDGAFSVVMKNSKLGETVFAANNTQGTDAQLLTFDCYNPDISDALEIDTIVLDFEEPFKNGAVNEWGDFVSTVVKDYNVLVRWLNFPTVNKELNATSWVHIHGSDPHEKYYWLQKGKEVQVVDTPNTMTPFVDVKNFFQMIKRLEFPCRDKKLEGMFSLNSDCEFLLTRTPNWFPNQGFIGSIHYHSDGNLNMSDGDKCVFADTIAGTQIHIIHDGKVAKCHYKVEGNWRYEMINKIHCKYDPSKINDCKWKYSGKFSPHCDHAYEYTNEEAYLEAQRRRPCIMRGILVDRPKVQVAFNPGIKINGFIPISFQMNYKNTYTAIVFRQIPKLRGNVLVQMYLVDMARKLQDKWRASGDWPERKFVKAVPFEDWLSSFRSSRKKTFRYYRNLNKPLDEKLSYNAFNKWDELDIGGEASISRSISSTRPNRIQKMGPWDAAIGNYWKEFFNFKHRFFLTSGASSEEIGTAIGSMSRRFTSDLNNCDGSQSPIVKWYSQISLCDYLEDEELKEEKMKDVVCTLTHKNFVVHGVGRTNSGATDTATSNSVVNHTIALLAEFFTGLLFLRIIWSNDDSMYDSWSDVLMKMLDFVTRLFGMSRDLEECDELTAVYNSQYLKKILPMSCVSRSAQVEFVATHIISPKCARGLKRWFTWQNLDPAKHLPNLVYAERFASHHSPILRAVRDLFEKKYGIVKAIRPDWYIRNKVQYRPYAAKQHVVDEDFLCKQFTILHHMSKETLYSVEDKIRSDNWDQEVQSCFSYIFEFEGIKKEKAGMPSEQGMNRCRWDYLQVPSRW